MSRLPQKLKSIRWPLILPFLVLALLAGAYGAWWTSLATRIETALLDWQTDQATRGIDVAWTELDTNGFPYRLEIHLTDPSVGTGGPDGWAWSADHMTGQLLPYNLDHVIIDVPGKQTIHYATLNNGAPEHFALHINSESFWASFVDEGGDEQRFALDMGNLVANRERVTRAETPQLAGSAAATRLQLHARPTTGANGTAFDAALRGEGLSWTGFGETPWPGATIARLDVQARLSNLPENLSRALPVLLPEAVASGTTLAISEFTLHWGAIDMTGHGEVTLDDQGRPEGRFRTSVGNLDGLIAALVEADIVSQRSAGLAFAGITALSSLQGAEPGRVNLPVAMKEGVLFLGPIAVARLDPVY